MSKASLLELCHGEKKYEPFSISHEQSKFSLKLSSTKYEIVNKQVKFLTTQHIGTCKSIQSKLVCIYEKRI